jgi:hypothetical protein
MKDYFGLIFRLFFSISLLFEQMKVAGRLFLAKKTCSLDIYICRYMIYFIDDGI